MPKRAFMTLLLCLAFVPASYAEDVYRDCINLVTDYAIYRDRFDAEGFSSLFTEDASLTVGGQTWVGRANIRERIVGINNGSSIRHLMSTIRITPVDADNATGISYATIYSAPAGSSTVEGFTLIGEYHDTFVRTSEGWKIRKRELHTAFNFGR